MQPAFGEWPIAKVMPSDVQKWIGEMQDDGLSPSRIRQAVIVLRQALDAAMCDERLTRNAAKAVKLPRLQRVEAPYLEPAEVDRIAEAIDGPNGMLVRVLGTLGLRFGEAAALQRQHVDLLRRRPRVDQSLSEVAGVLKTTSTKTHAVRQSAIAAIPGT